MMVYQIVIVDKIPKFQLLVSRKNNPQFIVTFRSK